MNKRIFNETNLLYLGIHDDCYCLYRQIKEIYSEEVEIYLKTIVMRDHFVIEDFEKIEASASKKAKLVFDEFLLIHTHIFTDATPRLYMSARYIKSYRFFVCKPIPPLKLEFKLSSFGEFLGLFEFCLVEKIDDIVNGDTSAYPRINVHAELRNRVEMQISKNLEAITISNPTYEVFPLKKIYVYKNLHRLSCNVDSHNIIPMKSTLRLTNENQFIQIPVHYCRDCKKVFIGNKTLKLYEKKFGKVLLFREPAHEKSHSFEANILNTESKLHKTGYNVVAGNWSEAEREAHLTALIKNNIMTQFQIMRDLENAINIFEDREDYSSAVSKWEHDLFFVSNFSTSKNDGVYICKMS